MATKKEKEALLAFLDEIETLKSWLEDTAYPRRSRLRLQEAFKRVVEGFGFSDSEWTLPK